MNPQNYCTRESAQRLVDAGIVIETEVYFQQFDGDIYWLVSKKEKDKYLEKVKEGHASQGAIFIPAPSMAEVWRELSERQNINACICEISFTEVGPFHVACYSWFYEAMSPVFKRNNPTDALIDLLIWARGKR